MGINYERETHESLFNMSFVTEQDTIAKVNAHYEQKEIKELAHEEFGAKKEVNKAGVPIMKETSSIEKLKQMNY